MKSGKMPKIDIIAPIFHIDLETFKTCIDSWYREIPIKRLIIGLGKENPELESLLSEYENVYVIDQYMHKTLGYCMMELIRATDGDFFVYLHGDVQLTENWFERMWERRVLGILESQKNPKTFGDVAITQAKKARAYSGAQLIYKPALETLNWSDDFMYCAEDLVIQNVITNLGYTYKKVPIFHNHYIQENKRTQDKETLLDWQWRALIKYAYPSEKLAVSIVSIIDYSEKMWEKKVDWETFANETNPDWVPLLKRRLAYLQKAERLRKR